jgi:site-specific recombinase XerD
MIDQLFTLPSTIKRLRQGPLSVHLDAYAVARAQQGYARHSIRTQVVVIADFSRWLQHKHISLQDLDGKVVDRFLQHHPCQKRGEAGILSRFLAELRQTGVMEQQEPPTQHPRQKVTHQFGRYLLQERGLSTATVQYYVPFIDQFLSERFRNHKTLNLSTLRAADLIGFIGFVQSHAHRLSSGRAKLLVTALRSFFRYLRHRGEISLDLAFPLYPSGRSRHCPNFSHPEQCRVY